MRDLSRSHLKTFVSVLALLPVLGLSASSDRARAAAPATGHGDAKSCAAMAYRTIAPGTVVTSAGYYPQGTSVGSIKVDVPFCRVIGVATPTDDSHIGFEVWLPPAGAWNGDFQAEGSGGSAGAISPAPMLTALKRGFATMSTDSGHLTDPKDPLGGSGQEWAFKHPQKMIDWGWRALHLSTIAAKAAIRGFYGKVAGKNYFVACSAGGHHALMEASRFPADYDGMVAGAAPWQWTRQMLGETWNGIPALKDATAITRESAALLNKAVIAACDKLDGVEDGVIADPRRCTFDPGTLACTASGKPGECLTPVQVDAARHIYAGVTRSDGTRLFPGQARGSEFGWPSALMRPAPGGSSIVFWSLSVFQDRNFNNVNFDFDRDTDRALATKVAGMSLEDVYDSKPDLAAFKARGGKLVLFQGWSDFQITPLVDIAYYEAMAARYGQAATDKFLRFFLLPGMGHCSGGPGFSHIGGATGAPIKDDADHDMVRGMEAWVTRNKAPAQFIAAHIDTGGQVTATRPVCMYPKQALYKGSGDPKDAASFVCAAPPAM